eukprot:1161565-Pelagomonas_calceolata.AAC.8
MESEFLNLGLEIIGLGVFNYDFGAINKESPVIKVRACGGSKSKSTQAFGRLNCTTGATKKKSF